LFTHLINYAAIHMKKMKSNSVDLYSINSDVTLETSVTSEAMQTASRSQHEKFVKVFIGFVEFLIINSKSL